MDHSIGLTDVANMPLRAGFVGEKFGSIQTMQLVLVGNNVVSDKHYLEL